MQNEVKKSNSIVDEIRLIQLLQLKTLIEIEKVCIKLGIHYYIIAGTLLGSQRHEGFIPWDSDIDIAMFRNDYNIFINKGVDLISNNFFIQSDISDTKNRTFFAKVRINDTYFNEKGNINNSINNGFYVDVFPLDDIKKYPGRIKFYKAKFIKLLIRVKAYKNGKVHSSSRIKSIVGFILHFFAFFVPLNVLNKYINIQITKENNKGYELVTNYNSKYGIFKQTMQKSIYGKPKKVLFEGISLSAPNDYKVWLKTIYGDYMKLPKQRPTKDDILKPYDYNFGKYSFLLNKREDVVKRNLGLCINNNEVEK
jgi:lipopolysaccharide cholinephosphotransferase